jgi:Flp pilus assembly protein TadG
MTQNNHVRKVRRQRGGTLVEAAVTFMVFFTFIMAIIEFSRALQIYHGITNAAREGARFSVAPFPGTSDLPSTGDVETRVNTFLASNRINGSDVNVVQTVAGTVNGIPTIYTQVDVSAPYQFLFFPLGEITLSTEAVMRNETN